MSGVFLDFATVSYDGDLNPASLLRTLPGFVVHDLTSDAELAGRLAGRTVAAANKVEFTRALLTQSPSLKLVALTATGTNNVDLVAARELGIGVCNVREYCTASVVQHVFAVLLALTHRLREYDRALKAGAWDFAGGSSAQVFPVRELAGRTLGVVGFGTLGRGVAEIARAFGMQVILANRVGEPPAPGRLDLDALLPLADVVTLHCPLTPATRNLISARELALMKPGAILINTARGGLVDPAALAAALRSGHLGGAAIDVLTEEPPVHGSPLLAPDLVNLIVTPHTAWAAREARQRAIDETAANIEDFLAGGRRGRVV
jgi:glycerate dehydrogenase